MTLVSVAVFGIVIAIFAGYYHDVLREVEWKQAHFHGLNGVASVHYGHYKDTFKVIQNVTATAVSNKLVVEGKTVNSFGIFYDNPEEVPDSFQWRSRGGLILEGVDVAESTPKYHNFHLKEQDCIMAEFPLVSPLSIFVGLYKVYPALSKHQAQTEGTHGAVVEIYDYTSKVIRYVALDKSSEDSQFNYP